MNDVHVDILTNELASWLSPREIATCRLVCHKWDSAFSDERVRKRVDTLLDEIRGPYFFLHELPGEWRQDNLKNGTKQGIVFDEYNASARGMYIQHDHPIAERQRRERKKKNPCTVPRSPSIDGFLAFTTCEYLRYFLLIEDLENERLTALARPLSASEMNLYRKRGKGDCV